MAADLVSCIVPVSCSHLQMRANDGEEKTVQPHNDDPVQAPFVDPFKLAGTTLGGKYRIDTVIGEGGFGVVYGGTHLLFGVPIAIKRMKLEGANARAIERFLREAKILFSMTHPAIVRLYDVGTVTAEAGTVPYVVLEHLDGGSLESEIALRASARPPRHFTAAELLRIFEPVLEGMAYVHTNGVAHRDLKPSNVMLVQDASRAVQAKVVDFGIARWGDVDLKTVAGGPLAFTPRYAAPEQWDPALGPTGPASDVFSLGMMIAETCMLKPVSAATGPAQLFAEVMRPRRLEIAALRPDLPDELEPILKRATDADPARRYETAGELLAAVRDVLAGGAQAPASSPRLAPVRCATAPAGGSASRSAPESRPGRELGMSNGPRSGARQVTGLAVTEVAAERHVSRELVAPGGGPLLLTCDGDHLTATWGPVFITLWKKEARVDAARAIQFALRDFAASTPTGRVACLTVIEAKAELPSKDARIAVANLLRFNAESIVCSLNVMEGEGFRAAAVRGVVTGISLVARQPFPHRTSASVALAASWVATSMQKEGLVFSSEELISAVESVRTAVVDVLPARIRTA